MESLKVKLLDLKGPDVYAEASSAYIREAEKIEDHIGLIVQLTDQLVNSVRRVFRRLLFKMIIILVLFIDVEREPLSNLFT